MENKIYSVMISNNYSLKGKYMEVNLRDKTYTTGNQASSSNSLLDISVQTNKQINDIQLMLDNNGFTQKESGGN